MSMRIPGFMGEASLEGGRSSLWTGQFRDAYRGREQVIPQIRCASWRWGFICCGEEQCFICDIGLGCWTTDY